MRYIFTALLAFILSSYTITTLAATDADSAAVTATDTVPELKGNWVQQWASVNFNVNHPGIRYPKFPNFCRKVYNWGDRTFNSYDTTYVTGTGKNWKVYAKNYNWAQSYAYIFNIYKEEQVMLHSSINSDFGINLSFMAVSVGYTWNVNSGLRATTTIATRLTPHSPALSSRPSSWHGPPTATRASPNSVTTPPKATDCTTSLTILTKAP